MLKNPVERDGYGRKDMLNHLKTTMASPQEFCSTNCQRLSDFQSLCFLEYELQIMQLVPGFFR